ncbi:MAG: hypothetical protein DI598_03115 [Pseudopedobacter saltans]|uniref:HTH cro/C1-type domain-containing protein n=1 Tax=Pseudopedobacter saltans TaxID=151895 RepID=A0A2W5H0A6_9SPHI|nr:MAG: hypothetical protein DI598_03115 [Pseudopedobacter saltans]
MNKYILEQKKKSGARIKMIRELLDYTPNEFAILTGLTENTISNVENGEGFNSNTISIISFLTGIELKELFNYSGDLPTAANLKQTFLKNVKKYNKEALSNVLNRRVTIKMIIEELVNNKDFFELPRKTKEIQDYIQKEYQKSASSSIISQALDNAFKDKIIQRKRNGLRNYIYYKK